MKTLFERVMEFDDSELERIQKEEEALLERLGASKLHDLDNVAFGKGGEMYALEDIVPGGDIVKNGQAYIKAEHYITCGENLK